MTTTHEMISRIALRVARKFLWRRAADTGPQLIVGGTVQIGNRAAKYVVKQFDGSLADCRFRIFFDVLGAKFVLSGQISKGRMTSFGAIDMHGGEVDANQMKRHFGVDPEMWIRRTLANALFRTVGEGDLDRWVVVDGEVFDSSVLDELEAAVHAEPMGRAV